jgi:hypothetical protein
LADFCHLRGAPFAAWTESVQRFAASETLSAQDHKAYLKTLLYPARFYYSWITGRIGSNDNAAAFVSQTCPTGLDVTLITRALQCRQAAADPDWLFAERAMLPSQVDACAALFEKSTHLPV